MTLDVADLGLKGASFFDLCCAALLRVARVRRFVVAIGTFKVKHGAIPTLLPKTRGRRAPRARTTAAKAAMTFKTQEPENHRLDMVAFARSLPIKKAGKHFLWFKNAA